MPSMLAPTDPDFSQFSNQIIRGETTDKERKIISTVKKYFDFFSRKNWFRHHYEWVFTYDVNLWSEGSNILESNEMADIVMVHYKAHTS